MADDPNSPPAATPPAAVVTPPAVVVPPAAVTPPATPPAATPPAPPAAPAAGIPQTVLDRIDRLTKDRRTAEERAVALETELARVRGAAPPPPAPGSPPVAPSAPVRPLPAAEIEQRAQELTQQRMFTEKCNGIAIAGQGAHPDFQQTIQQLGAMGALNPVMIDAALEAAGSADAHELLYALGKDYSEASRIAAMPPIQATIALARFNESRKATVAARSAASVSAAPAPPAASVGGGPPADNPLPQASDDSESWFRKREIQLGLRKAG